MRVAEIMNDYRNIHAFIAAIRASPTAEEYNEEGYLVLRRCVAEAQALLAQPFQALNTGRGDEEHDKMHLRRYSYPDGPLPTTRRTTLTIDRRIIVDAAMRRFRAQKIYLRATAALRWVNSRAALLQCRKPHAVHAPALQQIRNVFRAELSSITDQRVEISLRSTDSAAGKWLQEDPSLQHIQRMAGVVCGNGR
ncbi:hypothetical protein LTR91_001754 [Friedmanniomyces endolithicus]|uniref:Uncharacterized protein n=1 Tax=Friedmanniomyces endolithicus TaxID=329885 RepID=A0AAN6FW09_9PEZI|nr:hypothetical protein LTS09_013190 [Friedmanniomyces endolithicus]KAK0287454.1 hypothetical protein LTR35_003929 [Friedmanniomyces endolithicus]KAK0300253.1 hypothetical protein LTS00_001325 [Friedmanniomyces endolithicus]KAK0324946.1 hypothetical protein LTR82_003932 [Friedmanniomyces endolithicus]KAK1000025.1 hypothetical protein LTR54_008948 [Friedmanniomyces endolithicus]